jgi:hypothetical protein
MTAEHPTDAKERAMVNAPPETITRCEDGMIVVRGPLPDWAAAPGARS